MFNCSYYHAEHPDGLRGGGGGGGRQCYATFWGLVGGNLTCQLV